MPIEEAYEILDVIEFSSNRKRMSVVVRFPDGRVCVICKGADSVVMKRLKLSGIATQTATEVEMRAERRKSMEASIALRRRSTQIDRKRSIKHGDPRRSSVRRSTEVGDWLTSRENDVSLENSNVYSETRQSTTFSDPRSSMAYEDEEMHDDIPVGDDTAIIESCVQSVNEFATDGLRTLLYAYRFIDESEYAEWKRAYDEATISLVDREDKVEKAGEMIEHELDLAGATAIEDKLQDGVPESMDKLRRANIRIWMLTGDKRETAINIGHSCRLIKDYSTTMILDRELGDVQEAIGNGILTLQTKEIAHSVIIVDGHTLAVIAGTPVLEALFYDLAILADSVICCRAQPSQKALLVRGIRKRIPSSITLAIGDGANDIAMIQEAHVGIGITGKEGLQAARTSDYSIAQFRFLNKLLLVHGRWNYVRTCKYILGTLWKELVFFLTQALFQRWNGYTGTSLYEPWSLATFNTLFTSLPVLVMGIFEKDLAASTLLAVPELYTKGQKDGGFNIWVYLGWTAMASAEAMILFFVMVALFANVYTTRDASLFAMGDLDFVAVVIIISMKMQLIEMHDKSIIAFMAIVLSIGAVFLWNILLACIYPLKTPIYRVHSSLFKGFGKNPTWWFTLFMIVFCIGILEISVSAFRKRFFPTDADVFQELEHDPKLKERFEEAAAPDLQQGWNRGRASPLLLKPGEAIEMQELSGGQRAKGSVRWI
jgi:phospholipid-translocating ATPase